MWLARDKSGLLRAYYTKPERSRRSYPLGTGHWKASDNDTGYKLPVPLKTDLFPEITWETEPTWKRIILYEWIHELYWEGKLII